MKQFIQIAMSNGYVYQIPTEVIAQNRAAAMLAAHPEEFADLNAALEDTRGLFADDSWNIQDWAANNMNWEDLQCNAMLVRFKAPETKPWHEGEFTYHDAPALMGEFDGADLMKQPVEIIMHTMALARQLCNVTILHGEDQKPYGAFVMMLGDERVLNSYMSALKFTTDVLQPPAAPTD